MIAGCLKGGLRAAPMRRRKLAAGDVLFREGDGGNELYIAERGRLEITRRRGDGDGGVRLRVVGEKELVGEMAFFRDSTRTATATATATALDATEVVEVQMDSARDFLARGPVWMRMLVDTLASRLIEADLGLAVANRRLGSPGAESD
jgi:CRP/FNR family cyclic AMP-dependent transcriptional regulator